MCASNFSALLGFSGPSLANVGRVYLGFGVYQTGLSVGSTYYEELTSIKLGNRAPACKWARQN